MPLPSNPLQAARAFHIRPCRQVVPCRRLVAQPPQNHRCNGNHFRLTTCKILNQLQTSVLSMVVLDNDDMFKTGIIRQSNFDYSGNDLNNYNANSEDMYV